MIFIVLPKRMISDNLRLLNIVVGKRSVSKSLYLKTL